MGGFRNLAVHLALVCALVAFGRSAWSQEDVALERGLRQHCERAAGADELQQSECASSCADVVLAIEKNVLRAWTVEALLHLACMAAAAAVVVALVRHLVHANRREDGFVSGWAEPFRRAVIARSLVGTIAVHAVFMVVAIAVVTPPLRRADGLQRHMIRLRMHERARPSEVPVMTCRDLFSAATAPNRAKDFAQTQVRTLGRLSEYEGMYARASLPDEPLTEERFAVQFTAEWRQRVVGVAEDIVKVVSMHPRPYAREVERTLDADPNLFSLLGRNASLRATTLSLERLHFYLLAGWTWQWLISLAVGYAAGAAYLGLERRRARRPIGAA